MVVGNSIVARLNSSPPPRGSQANRWRLHLWHLRRALAGCRFWCMACCTPTKRSTNCLKCKMWISWGQHKFDQKVDPLVQQISKHDRVMVWSKPSSFTDTWGPNIGIYNVVLDFFYFLEPIPKGHGFVETIVLWPQNQCHQKGLTFWSKHNLSEKKKVRIGSCFSLNFPSNILGWWFARNRRPLGSRSNFG